MPKHQIATDLHPGFILFPAEPDQQHRAAEKYQSPDRSHAPVHRDQQQQDAIAECRRPVCFSFAQETVQKARLRQKSRRYILPEIRRGSSRKEHLRKTATSSRTVPADRSPGRRNSSSARTAMPNTSKSSAAPVKPVQNSPLKMMIHECPTIPPKQFSILIHFCQDAAKRYRNRRKHKKQYH